MMNLIQKMLDTFSDQKKLNPVRGATTRMGDQIRIPRDVTTYILFFPFQGDISDCWTPSLV